MGLMTIFSDESGYTGPNLTNRDQPYFVLATMSFEEHEAKAIRNSFFSSVRARELKHSNLSKNSKQHRMVLEYLKYLQSCRHRYKVYVIDKEFAVIAKIVDYLVETAAYKTGLNLYSDGSVVAIADRRKQTDEDFILIHDTSSPMVKETRYWEALTDKSVPPTIIGHGSKTMRFPIGVAETRFEDSLSWNGLQLADVLAGAVARSCTAIRREETDSYVRLISEIALDLPSFALMPGVSEDWPEPSVGQDHVVDPLYFVGEFYRKTRPN